MALADECAVLRHRDYWYYSNYHERDVHAVYDMVDGKSDCDTERIYICMSTCHVGPTRKAKPRS